MLRWPTTTVGAIIERDGGSIKTGPFGTALKADEYTQHGVPLISVGEVGNGVIKVHADTPRIAPEVIRRLPEYVLRTGDIVFGRKGAVERSALIAEDQDGWFLGSDGIRLRLTSSRAARFISYVLRTRSHHAWIMQHATGSTMASLNQGIISRIPVPDPPIEEQEAIAAVLSALDDKIELNRRMNETLEASARALFRDWFVDFGPTRAKVEGRPAYLAPDLWSLFPDCFRDDGVPEEWAMSSVAREFNLTMGQSPPGNTYNDEAIGPPFFQGRTDFGFRYPARRKFCSAPTRLASPDDTLISVRAPVGDLNMAWERCCIGRGVAAARHRSGSRSYTYHALHSIQPELEQFEHTGTVFGAINKVQFERLRIVAPNPELVAAFERQVGSLDDQTRANIDETDTLAATRDALLPKLMSGEIRVRDAEALAA